MWIDRPPDEVYAFAADRERLGLWASGLTDVLGEVSVEFAPRNEFGVLDHVVTLASGESVYNPMRVIPAGPGQPRCEVVFTVRRPNVTQDEFDADVAAVTADLEKLRRLLES